MDKSVTLTKVFRYLKSHPESYQPTRLHYKNEVMLLVTDHVLFPSGAELFPENRLHALSLDEGFIRTQPELVAWMARLISPEAPTTVPDIIWFTGCHLPVQGKYVVQLAFE
ncbi:hypothetical protein [Lacticaseibacillus hulanensis]|uniref:hypothetical protein n=1 Tax=Lacticaseibacillus hulanensis TaxID=2493111 RepID=UPI000FD81521|nr:hypothetical protein [Lacticaseibacillus hulanensis]